MKLDAKMAEAAAQAIQAEISTVTTTLKDKGSKRFERPLILSAIVLVASYYLLYLPPQRKLAGLQRRIDNAKAMSSSAEAYRQVRDRLRAAYEVMPKTKDKDQFLTQAVVDTLRAEGLTSDSIQPPDEVKDAGLAMQQLKVSAQMKFPELLGWLARLEASKPFIHVTLVELQKSKRMGYCEVQVGVSTIIPTVDLTR